MKTLHGKKMTNKNDESMHWADQTARRIILQKGDKEKYVCASGITPSGVVHIGNFREIITVDLVVRALKDLNKDVRFIYSWDDYDVFRKVPIDMPNQEMLKANLRKPIFDVPDPFGTAENYARHHELDVENDVVKVGISPEFIYQEKKYRACEYAEGIRTALRNKSKIPFKPLGDRALISPIAATTKSESGLEMISSTERERPQEGVVVAVGKGAKGEEMTVKVGDTVLYSKYAGSDVKLDGEDYLIMRESDIFGIK